jgi:hypothetical protein
MAAKRDYRAEYKRRIDRALRKGYSRQIARGHPKTKRKSTLTGAGKPNGEKSFWNLGCVPRSFSARQERKTPNRETQLRVSWKRMRRTFSGRFRDGGRKIRTFCIINSDWRSWRGETDCSIGQVKACSFRA